MKDSYHKITAKEAFIISKEESDRKYSENMKNVYSSIKEAASMGRSSVEFSVTAAPVPDYVKDSLRKDGYELSVFTASLSGVYLKVDWSEAK